MIRARSGFTLVALIWRPRAVHFKMAARMRISRMALPACQRSKFRKVVSQTVYATLSGP